MDEMDEPAVTRVCPRCSAQTAMAGQFCPRCGASFAKRSRRPSRRQAIVGLVVAALLIGGVGGVVVKRQHDETERVEAAADAQRLVEDGVRRADAAQATADASERTQRAELVTFLEEAITKDAKESVSEGLLDGPIKFTQCTATGGGSSDDLTALTGTFECLAATTENDDGTIEGYAYSGTTEWDSGSITWHLGR